MRKEMQEKIVKEHKMITKCIFQGLTIAQIARKLHYSQSTVSNRLNTLFKKYNAKNRFEFILSVFGDIIKNERYIANRRQIENIELKKTINNLLLNNSTCSK